MVVDDCIYTKETKAICKLEEVRSNETKNDDVLRTLGSVANSLQLMHPHRLSGKPYKKEGSLSV